MRHIVQNSNAHLHSHGQGDRQDRHGQHQALARRHDQGLGRADGLPPIRYVSNGNKVPKTDGARLCMKLPDAIPDDLDRTWYVQETYEILYDVGAYR